jgi:hypothetical protein
VTITEHDATRILTILADLRQRYAPGQTAWTGLDEQQARRMTQTWVNALLPFGIDAVGTAILEWLDGDRAQWFPSLNDLETLSRRAHLAVQLDEAQRHLADSADTCDGSGWVPVTAKANTWAPCARCNPVLSAVFRDRHKWARYMRGDSLDKLDVGVRKQAGELIPDAPMPPVCAPLRDEFADPVPGTLSDRPMPAWMRNRHQRPL